MRKIKKFAGYINLKSINGVLYPSSIQNALLKNYVIDFLNGIFYLSPTEVLQAKNLITLNTLVSNEVKVNGIVMLYIFFLPFEKKKRDLLYKRVLNNKKELHFVLDEIIYKDKKDVKKIEDSLIFRSNFFTKTRLKTSNFEKKIINSYKTSFV